ncbi:MAG: hypothetical protein EBU46_18535 [Nitrosomonadaceae bacterium]|nr:hypothetical protein [Nitrosomonadaceae bacterium]
MNRSVLYSREVLRLNKFWQPIAFETPEKVFGDLPDYCRDRWTNEVLTDRQGNPLPKMKAVEIAFSTAEDGSFNFDEVVYSREVTWDEWLSVEPRSYDLTVSTAHRQIRVPRVVVSLGYEKMPELDPNLDLDTIYRIYGGVCQYTKKKLTRDQATMDHVHARSRGGKHHFSNIVLSDREFNCLKSNRTLEEMGLPQVKPIIPKKLPMSAVLKNFKNVPEWRMFLPDP